MAAENTPTLVQEQTIYDDRFDPAVYLHSRYGEGVSVLRKDYLLREIHEFFKSNATPGMKVLDYGCGPVLLYSISAAAHASELVLADYNTQNHRAIQQWVDNDPTAFDWSSYFDYVVQDLEGGTVQQAREREEQFRRIVNIAHCDITHDTPIEEDYVGPYDIVTTNFCIECACSTLDEYIAGIKKVSSLVKPGGNFATCFSERANIGQKGSNRVGSKAFQEVSIDGNFVRASLEQCGLVDVAAKHFKGAVSYSDLVGTTFVCATKPF